MSSALAVAVLSMALTGPAFAAEPDNTPTSAESLAAVDDAVNLSQTVPADDSPVDIPTEAGQPAQLGDTAVSITPEADADASTSVHDGLTVYEGTATDASTVAQPTDNGVRFMTVINSGDAPDSYNFELGTPEGGSAEMTDNGGVVIKTADGEEAAHVAAPWAKDAKDVSLPTSYELNGTTLTQHVDLRNAAFPVVADPFLWVRFIGNVWRDYDAAHSNWWHANYIYRVQPTWAGRTMGDIWYGSAMGRSRRQGCPGPDKPQAAVLLPPNVGRSAVERHLEPRHLPTGGRHARNAACEMQSGMSDVSVVGMKRYLSIGCAVSAVLGFAMVAYYLYTGSVIMDQADAGEIPGGYTTPFQAFCLFGGLVLLGTAFVLLLVRLTRS